MYMDASKHAAFTGHPVTIGEDSSAEFRAFNGKLSGANLAVVRPLGTLARISGLPIARQSTAKVISRKCFRGNISSKSL